MSLRGFHIVFVFAATMSDLFVYWWTRSNPETVALLGLEWLRIASGWLAVFIIAYGLWFVVRKARTIIV
jgi:hypothetical protein